MSTKQNLVIGIHAVSELLKRRPQDISSIWLQADRQDQRLQAVRQLAQQAGVSIEPQSKEALDQACGDRHQGAAALTSRQAVSLGEQDLPAILDAATADPLLLILDGITDPHNLGACLRTADAAGVDAVIIPKDKSASLNATVQKVASGAAETVNLVTVTNLARCLDMLKQRGIWLVGTADGVPQSLYQQDLKGPLALVMGSEGSGLRRLTRESCDYLVSIPMAGELSSLNVSVATGVALFEVLRQRMPPVAAK
jgi:23S rRNA (guanosine2251-2'-O)-methyltransferase